jgi:4'-phosphopantetheinyl transferase
VRPPAALAGVCLLEGQAAQLPREDSWLGAEERLVLSGLKLPKRRDEWRLGRWTAKRALRCLETPAAEWAATDPQIIAAADGAPEARVAGAPLPLTLSLTHRAGCCVCAVAGGHVALGCDLELLEARSEAFARDYFTAEEQQRIFAASSGEGRAVLALALFWSAKESTLKALRVGLRRDTRSVVVQLAADEIAPTSSWKPLAVRDVEGGALYRGYWRTQGQMVLTLVAEPAPALPVALGA